MKFWAFTAIFLILAKSSFKYAGNRFANILFIFRINSGCSSTVVILNLIFTKVQINDSIQNNYSLGLITDEFGGFTAYGHIGFWGTYVYYFPKLDTSVSVFILEKDKREKSRDIFDQIIGKLQ